LVPDLSDLWELLAGKRKKYDAIDLSIYSI
jgi:hypothetical protein